MKLVGETDPEESESESCRVSSTTLLSYALRRGDSGWSMMGRPFLSIVLERSIFGGRKCFDTGKGDNGGVDPLSIARRWETRLPYITR